ncbi:O-succinylbenzoate synthase [Melghiribacillus thermohalophilus]|uniref:o-succinylbenzoate synthase n=1 Tax=Melghiribacillus thermohalophilus TaxID=1324956 RepID=A0A4R3MVG8_9BACI|nr:o-succinylbenzoate synthase [Melghiribacillus thermohalophilus]TCT19381.1 O-succinylbenzoate synthase [Melghiribacillus thermohalophilus]
MTNTEQPIKMEKLILHQLRMALKSPFSTSFGTFREKDFFIVEIDDGEGNQGFGESVAFSSPWYNEETVKTNEHIMKDFLIPLLFEHDIYHPDEVIQLFAPIRRNQMAKAAIEGAVWDLYAKQKELTLAEALGGKKTTIDVGISIGIQPTVEDLLEVIEKHAAEGYKRIKLKIKPGWDVDVIRQVRKPFPDISLMVDANSAYTLKDLDHLKQLDEFNLMMIEQPLAHDDIIQHAKLQKAIQTPICLDESIHSYDDARNAIELGSCKIINIKIGRVGGLTESKRIHDLCRANDIPVWCGGMLEAGVGRAHNIALTTLDHFVFPGDTAGSSRYWEEDIIHPEVVVKNGEIRVPDKPGIGYDINRSALGKYTVDQHVFYF